MTTERAIEILDPDHREHYESIEPVNEACRMAISALEKQIPIKPDRMTYDLLVKDGWDYACPVCGCAVGENRYVKESQEDDFCSQCGQALDWSDGK